MNYLHNRTIALRRTPGPISSYLLQFFPDLVASRDEIEPIYVDLGCTGMESPTWKEIEILHLLVKHNQPQRVLDIGSGIGWSAAAMALALPEGGSVTCVDPYTQTGRGLGGTNMDIAARFHGNINRAGLGDRIALSVHESPAILPKIAPEGGWDLVFWDGWAHDGQPLADIQGVMPYTNAQTVIAIRGFRVNPGVEAAAQWLASLKTDSDVQQWYFTGFITRTDLAIFTQGVYQKKGAYKHPKWWDKFNKDIDRIFADAHE